MPNLSRKRPRILLVAACLATSTALAACRTKPEDGAAGSTAAAPSGAPPVASSQAPTVEAPAPQPSAAAAPASADPFSLFDGEPPRLKPARRSNPWAYGKTVPILPGWETFDSRGIQRKDRSAFFLQWNINASWFDEAKLAANAKLFPLHAAAIKLGRVEKSRPVGKLVGARVGLAEMTIDREPATLWFAEVLCDPHESWGASDHLVWVFVAKNAAIDAVRDEGRFLLGSLTPFTDCSP